MLKPSQIRLTPVIRAVVGAVPANREKHGGIGKSVLASAYGIHHPLVASDRRRLRETPTQVEVTLAAPLIRHTRS